MKYLLTLSIALAAISFQAKAQYLKRLVGIAYYGYQSSSGSLVFSDSTYYTYGRNDVGHSTTLDIKNTIYKRMTAFQHVLGSDWYTIFYPYDTSWSYNGFSRQVMDAQGRVVLNETYFNQSGSTPYLFTRASVVYDAQGRNVKQTLEYDNNGSPVLDNVHSFAYDAAGNVIEEKFENASIAYKLDRTYNGSLLVQEVYSDIIPGSITPERRTFIYATGTSLPDTILTEQYHGSSWVPYNIEDYTYDGSGDMVRMERWSYAGMSTPAWHISKDIAYTYDAQHRLVEELEVNATKKTYTYNSDNLISRIEEFTWVSGSWRYLVNRGQQNYYYETYFPTSVQAVSKHTLNLNVYPNPAVSLVNVAASVPEGGTVSIAIYDMSGRHIKHITEMAAKGAYKKGMGVMDIPAGQYTLVLQCGSYSAASGLTILR